MSRKLAVTLSGAASLGSYEAGVLYEVLYALKQHNQQAGLPENQKIYIDVLTGASAGSLSVSLAAHKLLYEANSLDDPYNNPLYQAWVKDVDIDHLLTFNNDESPNYSILSSDFINNLTHRYLLTRYQGTVSLVTNTHPAVRPDHTLRLGLALSNLCGIDYTARTLGSGVFTYTRFQDRFAQTLGLAQDSLTVWESIQKAAVSSAAFPFAFRVQNLERSLDCYNSSPSFDPTCFGGHTTRSFTYTDGGLFQNEPLGLAKNLVDSVDQHLDSDQRAYLYIAPDPKTSSADPAFNATSGSFNNVAMRILSAIFNQACFEDWIEVERVNQRIAMFNRRAMRLHQLFANRILTPELWHPVLLSALMDVLGLEQEGTLAADRHRLHQQFFEEYEQLAIASGVTSAQAWIDNILLIERAAQLHDKDEMYIYAITATDRELAGSPLMAFLGFFDQEYRDHDYDVGRLKAQAFLQNPGTAQQGPLSAIHYTPLPVRPLKPGLTGTSIQQAPLDKRRKLRNRLRSRAAILLKEEGLSVLVRQFLLFAFINPKIDELLAL